MAPGENEFESPSLEKPRAAPALSGCSWSDQAERLVTLLSQDKYRRAQGGGPPYRAHANRVLSRAERQSNKRFCSRTWLCGHRQAESHSINVS